MVDQLAVNQWVGGSSPSIGAKFNYNFMIRAHTANYHYKNCLWETVSKMCPYNFRGHVSLIGKAVVLKTTSSVRDGVWGFKSSRVRQMEP